jgi:DNA mismatch repair protein MSH5
VALIAYLAHIGSFVPANSAKIGIVHHIHTRIQTVESVATNISAFMIDMKQVNYAKTDPCFPNYVPWNTGVP